MSAGSHWIAITAQAPGPLYSAGVELQLRSDDGQRERVRLQLCDATASDRVVWRCRTVPSEVAVLETAEPLTVSFREITPLTARLAMARQLALEDPLTLFDDPLELHRALETVAVEANERLWLRYSRYLRQRPRPLLPRHPLSRRAVLAPFRPEREMLERLRWLAPRVAAQGAPGAAELPAVSLVVPCYGKLAYTLRCLESVLADQLRAACCQLELLLVDDASPDGSGAVLAELDGLGPLRVLRNPDNLGFLRSCNRAAALANGDFLGFLNNDTVVAEGWLGELLASFRRLPAVGLAGAMLLYPDGRLQESGGLVWRDASAANVGRGGDPEAPELRHLRDVDYASGAAILVRRALFRELGGFDSRYAPAYYEDTDLAFGVRQLGQRVVVQPSAQVVHDEGVSSGRDEEAGSKRHQQRNAQLFRRKWSKRLEGHGPGGENLQQERQRGRRGRVLVLEACTPSPDQDAGSLFMFNILLALDQLGYAVSFCATANLLYMPEYSGALERLGIRVLVHPHIGSIEEHLREEGASYHGVLMARPEVAEACLDPIKAHAPQARLLYYTHDLHHLRMERQHRLAPHTVLPEAIAAMRRLEQEIVNVVDGVLYLSEAEQREAEERLRPRSQGWVLPPVVEGSPGRKGHGERRDLVFIGGFQHPPNTDAVLWFAEAVLPLLRQAGAGLVLHVVGAGPPAEIQALAGPDLVLHGYVADLEGFLGDRRIAVAPLRFGAGVKGKVLTTLAAGVPLVATAVACEGLGLKPGLTVLQADTAEAMAAAVLELNGSALLWDDLARQGLEHVRQGWGAAACRERLRQICTAVGLPAPGPEDELEPALSYRPELVRRLGPAELLAPYNLEQLR